ncbi:hypothetical protein [Aquimarina celericrescens]|uniref:DUF3868 domain-containing protein n=1 Tax=Aquimarina celericrescens TaxID=1964542 RepID=A0ABW5ATM7_9FLAO|nr:hypothetical protein [Aquimarina celericrescens]
MIKAMIIILGIFYSSSIYAQKIKYDTVFIKRPMYYHDQYETDTIVMPAGTSWSTQVLTGTSLLKNSKKLSSLSLNGVRAISLEMLEPCSEDELSIDNLYDEHRRIVSLKRENDILTVDVTVVSYCCNHFLGEAYLATDTITLSYIDYGENCSCHCLYTLSYKFDLSDLQDSLGIKYIGFTSKNRKKIPKKS